MFNIIQKLARLWRVQEGLMDNHLKHKSIWRLNLLTVIRIFDLANPGVLI